MNRIRRVAWLLMFAAFPTAVLADAVDRMKLDQLRKVHEAVETLANERQPVALDDGYDDVRALLHVHSHWSHDSHGTVDEIIAAAKTTGVRVIMFSEHPADTYDYFKDGNAGMIDGVLLIPGAETRGFLAYPTRSIQAIAPAGPQEFADLVRRDDGLIFLSHLEERMDWDIAGLTGTEIYNTHADFKDETRLIKQLRNPLMLLSLMPALEKYPQEVFGAIQDYPADYLRRFDELCQQSPHTGVAANDSHHNQGIRAILKKDGKVQVEDNLGNKIITLDASRVGFLKSRIEGKRPGDEVLRIDLDPYDRSFRHVSTHLLMHEVSRDAVWQALKAARAYVGFDWIADPSGFVFFAEQSGRRFPMGSHPTMGGGMQLHAAAPLEGTFKLLRDGKLIQQADGRKFDFALEHAGIYRLEVWLDVAGEPRPWILSNPIYVGEKP